jgi:hypothetical protein
VLVLIARISYKFGLFLPQIPSKIKLIMKDYIVSVIYLELFGVLFEFALLDLFV